MNKVRHPMSFPISLFSKGVVLTVEPHLISKGQSVVLNKFVYRNGILSAFESDVLVSYYHRSRLRFYITKMRTCNIVF